MVTINHIPDRQMFRAIERLKLDKKIRFNQQVCDALGVKKQLLRQIKIGKQHFTTAQLAKFCKVYKVNANYILNIEKEMYRG